jgi:1-acyl-sn-glycerol-3-phosphate acyltransferase
MASKTPNYPTGIKSTLYSFLQPWVANGQEFFFDGFHVNGIENFPKDCPVILVGNHQNAMLDPLVFCRVIPKQLHWLARSDVFKNPMAAKFLYQLHILPIYREKDKVEGQMEKNEAVFATCRTRLSNGAVIAMFPEGSHRGKKQLMTPLKKGFARLAFSSVEKDNNLMDLKIVPVGMDYSDFYNYHPRMIFEFGEPIAIKDFWDIYTEDPGRGVNALLKATQERLSSLMVDFRDDEAYDMLMEMAPSIEAFAEGDTIQKWQHYREYCNAYSEVSDIDKQSLDAYWQALRSAEMSADALEESLKPQSWKWKALWCIEAIPGLLGRLLYFPHYWITEKFIQKKIEDELFYNSIRIASFTFLTPFYLLLIWSLIANTTTIANGWYTHVWGLLLLMSLGMFGISWTRLNRKMKKYRTWKNWSKSNTAQSEEILNLRNIWRKSHEK